MKTKRCEALGDAIRALRESRGWTIEHLAERADLTVNYVGRIERGLPDLGLSSIEALARALEVPTGALLGPLPELSDRALEAARLFETAPRGYKAPLLQIMRRAGRGSK